MSVYFQTGSPHAELAAGVLEEGISSALEGIGPRARVLAVPPDMSRFHSRAGAITELIYRYYGDRLRAVLPAVGTHAAMTAGEQSRMFGVVPHSLFRSHNWRTDVATLGEVPGSFLREQSEGKLDYAWPAQVNRLLLEGGFDLILSIGQVVPHEVIGMANGNKNILIGTGGPESIHRSHYLGAVYGMERIMGRTDTPVRRVLNYADDHFLRELPIVYILTVVGINEAGESVLRGLFIGDSRECFEQAAALAFQVNFEMLDREIRKAVVYLDPAEFKSTWLGNKAIYRTRMALADDAELIVLAPGVRCFGEDPEIDRLIRQFGYFGTPATLRAVESSAALAANLSAAAHLIHGSSEGRFRITYCPGRLSASEIEAVGFDYAASDRMLARYNPAVLRNGYNTVDGEEVYFIANPGLGLWACRNRFEAGRKPENTAGGVPA